MTDQVLVDEAPATWPLAPDEHPDLPRLHIELHEGRPAVPGRGGADARPPYLRLLLSPIRVLQTCSPDRIRALATALNAAADGLQAEHTRHAEHTGQLFTERP